MKFISWNLRKHRGDVVHGRVKTSSLGIYLGIAFISVVASLLLLEIGVRSYDHLKGRGFLYNGRNLTARGMKSTLPFRTFGLKLYKEIEGFKYISSVHRELYPLVKPEGTFRIVAFGGSTTVNNYAFRQSRKHYPLLLETKLRDQIGSDRIEVINVANSGYATPHSLILLILDVISWKPDLVILSHNNNDLIAAYWPNFEFDYSHMYAYEAFVPYHASHYTVTNAIFQYFQVYWLAKDGVDWALDKVTARTRIRRTTYGEEPPVQTSQVFERNLRSFVTLAKANGIKVLLATQPLQPLEEYFTRLFSGSRANSIVIFPFHDQFVKHHAYFNDIIGKVAKDSGVWLIENDIALGIEKSYFIDHIHYSELGVEKLAQSYFDFLITQDLVK